MVPVGNDERGQTHGAGEEEKGDDEKYGLMYPNRAAGEGLNMVPTRPSIWPTTVLYVLLDG